MERDRGAAEDVRSSAESQGAEVCAYLETLLASPAFSGSARRAQLLRYLVEHALAGDGERLNEYAIGVDVFGKPASFDPRLESVVRTELSRLRQKLKDYYKKDGLADRIQIEFPPRSYVPAFQVREAAPPAASVRPIRRWWAAVAVGALAVAVIAIWTLRNRRGHPVNSIAVLPFVNLSPDHRDDYLADGITEELTNDLAQSRDLRVVARTSAWVFKGKAVDIREIGRRLNAENALEGSFEREGDRVRITAQLNRTTDGYHVWSHSYEVPAQDLMIVQQQAAQAVIAALHPGGVKAATAVATDSTRSPAAHDLYLRAYELALHRTDSYWESLALFQQAVRADPSYVNAYLGIARLHITLIHLTQESPEQGIPAARAALEKALTLDPSSGEARGMLADLVAVYDRNWPVADREFRRALAEGVQSTTHSYYGLLLATHGRFREAQTQLRVAEDLDPLGMGPRFNQFMAFNLEHDYPRAKQVLGGMLEMKPDEWDAHFMLGVVAAAEHDCNQTRAQFEWCARKFQAPVTKIGSALAAACTGDRQRTLGYLAEARKPDKAGYASPYQLALGYAAIGDNDTALSLLEKSAEMKEMQILYIKYDPLLDAIRMDPRFIALEKRVGLLE